VTPWALRQLTRKVMAAVLPRRLFLVSGPPSSGCVCLTFDDGPDPRHTPRLLDALGEHGVRATFFVIGRQAERHPELVRRIAADGHAIGHHSFHHTAPHLTPARLLVAEAGRTAQLLDDILGRRPTLFRPPLGKLTPLKLCGLWAAGQTVVLWNVDPKDFACGSGDELSRRLESRRICAGDVILMHDNHPHAAAALPTLVARVRRQGVAFTTVDEWVPRREPRGRDDAYQNGDRAPQSGEASGRQPQAVRVTGDIGTGR
jgi:peptidoglycan/xylan/chitin deacetylase (PgdA/CDA1 family)